MVFTTFVRVALGFSVFRFRRALMRDDLSAFDSFVTFIFRRVFFEEVSSFRRREVVWGMSFDSKVVRRVFSFFLVMRMVVFFFLGIVGNFEVVMVISGLEGAGDGESYRSRDFLRL